MWLHVGWCVGLGDVTSRHAADLRVCSTNVCGGPNCLLTCVPCCAVLGPTLHTCQPHILIFPPHTKTGPEPGLTRDPTYGWIKHGPLDIQLVDTAGWKKASALLPTQAPTAAGTATGGTSTSSSSSRGGIQQAATAVAASQADSAAAAAGGGDSRLVGKQLADASLVQARRALGACHVVVLMLDAPRLLTIEQVRVFGVVCEGTDMRAMLGWHSCF